jgi:ribosomal protein S17E
VQGRVRTKTVKKASRVIIEKYYARMTLDFQVSLQKQDRRKKLAGWCKFARAIM